MDAAPATARSLILVRQAAAGVDASVGGGTSYCRRTMRTIWTMVAWRPVSAAVVPSRDTAAIALRSASGVRSYAHPPFRQSVTIPAQCQASTLTLPRGRATHIRI
jgi:hypothetical protein